MPVKSWLTGLHCEKYGIVLKKKGYHSSSWLIVLPYEKNGFVLKKRGHHSSSWLTGLHCEKYGFVLNKLWSKDAIALRCALPIANITKNCVW